MDLTKLKTLSLIMNTGSLIYDIMCFRKEKKGNDYEKHILKGKGIFRKIALFNPLILDVMLSYLIYSCSQIVQLIHTFTEKNQIFKYITINI